MITYVFVTQGRLVQKAHKKMDRLQLFFVPNQTLGTGLKLEFRALPL